MPTQTQSKPSRQRNTVPAYVRPKPHAASRLDPDEIRRIVQLGKERGLISGAGTAGRIDKTGDAAAQLGGVRSQWMNITPAKAKTWLENNFRNRPLSEDVVHAYARDMINEVWIETHQGLAFNDKDELIDGQHRLHAIVLSGVTVRMMVTFGLPSAIAGKEMTTMDAVDRGRTRSVADQLKIQHGFKDGSITASICKSLAAICSSDRTRRLSVGQTLEIFRAFEAPVQWVIAHRSKEVGLRQAGALAGFAFAIATEQDANGRNVDVGTGKIAAMFGALVSGEDLKPRSAITHLRTFLTSDEAKLLTRGTDRGLAELVLQAIFLEQQRKPVTKLELAPTGADHFRTLQKERVDKVAAMFALPKKSG